MAVQVELWKPDIIEGLYKSNPFLTKAKNADSYVVGGRIVHIPQAGAPSSVVKNRSSLPATVVQRTDTDITYTLDEFTTDPTLIPYADTVELSYDKRQSVIRENTAYLNQVVADNLLYRWTINVPAGNKILTSGAAGAATAPGATGTRKILTEADLRSARVLLDKQNMPAEGRVLLISADMLNHLMGDNNLKYAFQSVVNLPNGVIARLFGFDIMVRSSVIRQATGGTAGTVKVPEAANATTDDEAALFYQMDAVERALGEVNMFQRNDDPLYYGDVYSFLLRLGGRAVRGDNAGVGLIVAAP